MDPPGLHNTGRDLSSSSGDSYERTVALLFLESILFLFVVVCLGSDFEDSWVLVCFRVFCVGCFVVLLGGEIGIGILSFV